MLETDDGFAAWYTELLANAEYEAYFWEHPPICEATFDNSAEFVLIDGPSLARLRFDPVPFRNQFEHRAGDDIATFPNLGGDAILIAPRPVGNPEAYAHLAAFIRRAPAAQVRSLWQHTGRAVRENLATSPTWVSTAGMGVSWLHLRLDSWPKYYCFSPYKAATYSNGES